MPREDGAKTKEDIRFTRMCFFDNSIITNTEHVGLTTLSFQLLLGVLRSVMHMQTLHHANETPGAQLSISHDHSA